MTNDKTAFRIRRLWPLDLAAFRRHLLRLDAETRQARFGTPVSDDFLDAYADTAGRIGTVIYGAFIGSEMYASAEMRGLHVAGDAVAEAAFAVEPEHQHHGLGSLLMDRIITAAQNRGIGQLYMICMRDNDGMRALAGKFGARLRLEAGDVTGEIAPAFPTPVSIFDEAMRDAQGFVTAVLDWRV